MNLHRTLTFIVLLPLGACGGAGASAGATAPTSATARTGTADIIDTAVSAGSFKTLVAAVKAAGLESTLRGPGPFTVFAPTDDAFAKLPAGTLADLLKPENKAKLVSILTYHVVSGDVSAADAMKLSTAKTVEGGSLSLKTSGGSLMVGNATVTKADIVCSNGVIHVIDTVLLPGS
jgi:uncharacterized surface protein with fasciclin (FAS1) repeats